MDSQELKERRISSKGQPTVDQAAKPRRILVVDDDHEGADVLAELLEAEGFETLVAYDAWDAIRLAQLRHPLLAIVDLDMPGISGFEAAPLIREQCKNPTIGLVAYSGRSDPETKVKVLDAGFDLQLLKPATWDEMMTSIRTLL